jgi:hypothetical protein
LCTQILGARSPNEKLNMGFIGVGGKGHSDLGCCSTENVVALCDVDDKQAAAARKDHPNAKFYYDYREMLEKEKGLDAVVVSTPDHHHAPASVMAMKLGKHVYTQKPLVHTVYEARVMRETAARMKVVTQMGNQGSAEPGLRRAVEIIQAGALGPVHQVHVWSNRPIWPQGLDRPQGSKPVPETLKWDLFLGPAPERPYNDGYTPFAWRGWIDYGTGALGDMACHTANMPFRALKLEYPTLIEAEAHSGINPETYPKWSRIRFEFPARGEMPPLTFYWYDGGQKPAPEITSSYDLASRVEGGKKKKKVEILKAGDVPGSGCLILGEKGALFSPDDYGAAYRIFPEEDFKDYKGPPETLPRLDMTGGTDHVHHQEWIRGCKGGPKPYSSFDYAALLTETILLGNIALRTGVNYRIEWDGPNMKSTNSRLANQLVHTEYRSGWTL